MDFERLVRRHKDAVYRQMVRVCGDYDDAEDVLQQAILNAFRSMESLRDHSAFRAWLARIGRNVCTRLRKREALKPVIELGSEELEADGPDPHREAVSADIKATVRSAVDGLPPIYSTVLRLRDLDGLTSPEVALRLGLTVPAVKARLLRARAKLRDSLDARLA